MKIRTRLVVLSKFQRWFFINFVLYVSTSLLLVGSASYLWIKIVAEDIMKLAGLIRDPAITLVKLNADQGVTIFAVLCLALLALATLQAFIFSRKIAGPVFAITKHLEKCERTGHLEKIKLRKGDLFFDLENSFNRVVDTINSKSMKDEVELPVRKKISSLSKFGRG